VILCTIALATASTPAPAVEPPPNIPTPTAITRSAPDASTIERVVTNAIGETACIMAVQAHKHYQQLRIHRDRAWWYSLVLGTMLHENSRRL